MRLLPDMPTTLHIQGPGGSGTDSGSAVGRSPGSAEQELLGCQCQSPGLRALLEEVDSQEAGEPPGPAEEVWGC